jgi:hypothetical protein
VINTISIVTLYHLDVKVPGVVLVVGDVDPGVLGDDPLVEGEDRLVTRLDPAHLSRQSVSSKDKLANSLFLCNNYPFYKNRSIGEGSKVY